MDREYHRLLSRDRNPFAFLYSGTLFTVCFCTRSIIQDEGFRRNWGTYESTYLCAKLSTLVVVAVIDTNNCLFRSLSPSSLPVARQILLLLSTIGFFASQCIFAPFLDPVNNASEWVSRLNYVTTAIVALAVALDIPGQHVLNTYVLYVYVPFLSIFLG